MGPMTRDAYARILDEDIKWIKTVPRTLEREHVLSLLQYEREHMSAYGESTISRLTQQLREANLARKKMRVDLDRRCHTLINCKALPGDECGVCLACLTRNLDRAAGMVNHALLRFTELESERDKALSMVHHQEARLVSVRQAVTDRSDAECDDSFLEADVQKAIEGWEQGK